MADSEKMKKVRKRAKSASVSRRGSGAKYLVIVESPGKAEKINHFLGKDYFVVASMGHIRDLPKSRMAVDIEHDFTPEYIIPPKSKKIEKQLKKDAENREIIYLAPDEDREGEAIAWHLKTIFSEQNHNQKFLRVKYGAITKDAVLKGFANPSNIDMNLVDAQQARRILDRVVGYQISPLLWKNVGRGLSAGRVQSVALRFIVEREREIKAFKPEEYWTLDASLSAKAGEEVEKKFTARFYQIGDDKAKLKEKEITEQIKKEIENLPFVVESVDVTQKRRRPQAPYTTSKLQQEASSRLGFTAANTMRIAQKLYEGVDLGADGNEGLITYMRTDSVNVSPEAADEAAKYILGTFGKEYLPEKPNVYKAKKNAQEAHEAIRPTNVLNTPEKVRQFLEADELKLYEMIWRKFIASQMTPTLDEHIAVIITAGNKYYFKTTGKKNIFPGYTAVFGDFQKPKSETQDAEDDLAAESNELPKLSAGEALLLRELLGEQHFTKPPAHFNDASLIELLDEKGIGRPSTYAPTIATLLARMYVERKAKALISTELGETVLDLLVQHFPTILDEKFTARMEEELDEIASGEWQTKGGWVQVLKDFYGPFGEALTRAQTEMKNVRPAPIQTEYKCDKCGKPLVIKFGRFGKFMACSGFPDCKFTRSIPTGFFCPKEGCGGELVKRRTKAKGQRVFYGCSKYPECDYKTNTLPQKNDDEALSQENV